MSSNMPDGSSASENYERIPGITVDLAGSAEEFEVILEAQRGRKPIFVQSKGVTWRGAPANAITFKLPKPSNGTTLLAKFPADAGPLFLTDNVGNTYRSVPKPFGAKIIDQERVGAIRGKAER